MVNWQALAVFVAFFVLVTVIGIFASHWHKGNLNDLSEWGLGGRRFGVVITWFLVGGDLYTAYTLIAVPALVFGKGALGMFALPYTIVVYPLMIAVMPRLWQVAANRGHITPSDYVKDRFNSRFLALLVAITSIFAVVPYIALQMYGIEVVISYMGVPVTASLIIAFVIIAVFTYVSGIRAPALIALVKDGLIYSAFIIAIVYVVTRFGGFGQMFAHVPTSKIVLPHNLYAGYSTLFLGSALSLFLYPHAITAVFASKSRKTVKTNMSILPAYTLLLGLIALLGFAAIAMGLKATGAYGANGIVPELFLKLFPAPFVGYAFAAIAIGALVPASIMGIAAANLFSRNIYHEYIRTKTSSVEDTIVAKVVSILVLVAALAFILVAPTKFVINFQLAGSAWILQILPAIVLSLFVHWLDRRAVVFGLLAGLAVATQELIANEFASSLYPLAWLGGTKVYIGLTALVVNIIVVLVISGILWMLHKADCGRRLKYDVPDTDASSTAN